MTKSSAIDTFGYALHLAQIGKKHPQAKPLQGFGSAGVLEVVEDWHSNTYRAVYTVRFAATANRQGAMTMGKRSQGGLEVEVGSGNVYADLGYPDADEMLIKAQFVSKIADILKRKGLNQTQAAALLGLTQPKLSNLLSGQFRGFSERRLMDCLTRLGRDVQIVVTTAPRSRAGGKLSVVFA